jgi:hypothetical protein
MTIQDIFLIPGHLAVQFIFNELLRYSIESVDLVIYWVMAIVISLLFWVKFYGILRLLVLRLVGIGK